MSLLSPIWLHALWAAPVVLALAAWAWAAQRRAVRRYFGKADTPDRRAASRLRPVAAAAFGAAGLALIALALARPAYNPRPQTVTRQGRDVVFIIDVSRSMLAQDLKPSRLERAKLMVQDCLDAASGDRIGLIAFAGTAEVRSPLTTDYSFLSLAVRELSTQSIGVGGTNIGDAIRLALSSVFKLEGPDPTDATTRDIFIITDGEDHDSSPLEAATEAGALGVRIVTIGLGDELEGATINEPTRAATGQRSDRQVRFRGEVVRTKLDTGTLRAIAAASPGGRFVHVGTGDVELDRLFTRMGADASRRRIESAQTMKYDEVFQWLLLGALGVLALREVVRER